MFKKISALPPKKVRILIALLSTLSFSGLSMLSLNAQPQQKEEPVDFSSTPAPDPTVTPSPTATAIATPPSQPSPVQDEITSLNSVREWNRSPAISVGEIHVQNNKTTVEPGETILLWIDPPTDYDTWTENGETGQELDNTLFGEWSNGATGFSTYWTAPQTQGEYRPKITVNDDISRGSTNGRNDLLVEKSVTIAVKSNANYTIEKLQIPVGGVYRDAPDKLYVLQGDRLTFRAVSESGNSWPSGYPVWSGETSGTGAIKTVTFDSLSQNPTDFKEVTAQAWVTKTVQVLVSAPNYQVRRVNFSGNNPLRRDQAREIVLYDSPQWNAAREEVAYPLNYKEGSKPIVNAAFSAPPLTFPRSVRVRGVSALCPLPSVNCSVEESSINYPASVATKALPQSVQKTTLSINWEYSTDGGSTWTSMGGTNNRLYVTMSSIGGLLTTVDVACRNAVGKYGADSIFNRVWSVFDPLNMQTVSGRPMRYWGEGAGSIEGNTPELIAFGNGTCGMWADFFIEANRVQNLGDVERVRVVLPPSTQTIQYLGFTVKPIPGQNMPPPGQNTPLPTERYFVNHVFTKRADSGGVMRVYDPSYGLYFSSQQKWEDGAVESLKTLNPSTGLITNEPKRVGVKELAYDGN